MFKVLYSLDLALTNYVDNIGLIECVYIVGLVVCDGSPGSGLSSNLSLTRKFPVVGYLLSR